jgi:selenocysteine lyase/cysteine desulfurase
MSTLIAKIARSVIGARAPLRTPFGVKPLIYADYTASGRSLTFIEDYLREHVLPWYANTHSESSFTGAQTTALREQARRIIRDAVNGGQDDLVIFCGSGATTGINRVIEILGLHRAGGTPGRPHAIDDRPAAERAVVFVGPYEHHSNELPWRESTAEVVRIGLAASGHLDLTDLQRKLTRYQDRPMLIGSFSAASNVTGIRTDVAAVTALLKAHGALAFWDYAAAAPYTAINMQGEPAIDGAFVSPHKFIGGPGTPGVLLLKRHVITNRVPSIVGGGTVMYVTPEDHQYIDDPEHREEGGTPAVIETVRAGLAFKLQQEVGLDLIEEREQCYIRRAMERLAKNPSIEILGNTEVPRLSILSLRFRHSGRDLHYGFVVALLNDLFGIQLRGGCSCAGPYGHSLLNLDLDRSRALEREIRRGAGILRPGWVRLNFNYFIDEAEFEYLLAALELVAEHGWRLLPFYAYDVQAGIWSFRAGKRHLPASLHEWSFQNGVPPRDPEGPVKADFDALLELAHAELLRPRDPKQSFAIDLPASCAALRWFVLPQETLEELEQGAAATHALTVPMQTAQ